LIEEQLWAKLVQPHLATDPTIKLPKKAQQGLASALQSWTAGCITSRLETIIGGQLKKGWEIHHKGKDFLGAVRRQEVDVWLSNPDAGLALAVDPKHFQSSDSLNKNWKNGHNDLVAFATNLHERFPLCSVGGIIAFPDWTASKNVLKQMTSICSRSIPRERALNAYGKFEGFALAIYNKAGKLIWPLASDSPLRPSFAFQALAGALVSRTIGVI